jgi:hypothetical protein
MMMMVVATIEICWKMQQLCNTFLTIIKQFSDLNSVSRLWLCFLANERID